MTRAILPLIIAGFGCFSWDSVLAAKSHHYMPAVQAEQSDDDSFYPALKPGRYYLVQVVERYFLVLRLDIIAIDGKPTSD